MVKINLQVSNLLLTFVKTKNKTMKKLLFLLMSVALVSCSNKYEQPINEYIQANWDDPTTYESVSYTHLRAHETLS
jgi:hypothetical protein